MPYWCPEEAVEGLSPSAPSSFLEPSFLDQTKTRSHHDDQRQVARRMCPAVLPAPQAPQKPDGVARVDRSLPAAPVAEFIHVVDIIGPPNTVVCGLAGDHSGFSRKSLIFRSGCEEFSRTFWATRMATRVFTRLAETSTGLKYDVSDDVRRSGAYGEQKCLNYARASIDICHVTPSRAGRGRDGGGGRA